MQRKPKLVFLGALGVLGGSNMFAGIRNCFYPLTTLFRPLALALYMALSALST